MIKYIFLFISLVVLSACGDEAEVPVYLRLEEPEFFIGTNEGTDKQEINEHFVFHNTALLGGYSTGKNIPILAEGEDELLIFAGIRRNAVSTQPNIYFMFLADTMRADFQPGQTYTFKPTYRYSENVLFHFIEEFESGTDFIIDLDGNNDSRVVPTPGLGYNGTGGGVIDLTKDYPVCLVSTDALYDQFPSIGDVIIEMTYKTDVEMRVGVRGVTPTTGQSDEEFRVGLRPTDEWTKVYIDVNTLIRGSRHDQFQVLIGAALDTFQNDQGRVILDDIKFLNLL